MPASLERRRPRHAERARRGEVFHLADHRRLDALAGAQDVDRLRREILGPLGRRQDQRAAAVGHQAALQQAERIGDHPRAQHVVDGDRIAERRARVLRRPLALHHRDHGDLLVRHAVGLHVAQHRDRKQARRAHRAERLLELPVQAGRRHRRGGMRRSRDRPLSPCVIRMVFARPASIAAAAWRTWIMNEQPPTDVPSTQVGVMPR